MKTTKALLMGGACLGLASYQALSPDGIAGLAHRAQEMIAQSSLPVGHAVAETRLAENEEKAAEPEAAPAAEPAAAAANIGVTSFYGGGEPDGGAAWAAEATMNPDYTAAAADAAPPAAAAPAEAAPEAAPAAAEAPAAPAAAAQAGVTSYFGIAEAADSTHAWAAEATMNPDYAVAAAPAPAEPAAEPAAAVPAPAAEEPAPVSLGGQAVTSYFGEGQTPDAGKPWAAEALLFSEPPAAAQAAPASQAAVESCRDALNAELLAGKLLFSNGSWDILAGSYKTLDKVAKIAKGCDAGFVIEIGGHTDNTGKPASNKTLSELRAKSVVDYLTRGGVDASKLKAVGYGQENPIAPNTTREGRQLNRRIEFLVTSN